MNNLVLLPYHLVTVVVAMILGAAMTFSGEYRKWLFVFVIWLLITMLLFPLIARLQSAEDQPSAQRQIREERVETRHKLFAWHRRMVTGAILFTLAVIAVLRVMLRSIYASELRGKDVREEFDKTLNFIRRRRVVGSVVVGLWFLEYVLILGLAVGDGGRIGVEPRFLWGLAPTGNEPRLENFYVPGFKLSYEPEDYERAATDWILQPQKYRFGSYKPRENYYQASC